MKHKILVSGNVNIETTLDIQHFPVEYSSVNYKNFGINTKPAGVAFNITIALDTLGSEVNLLSFIDQGILGSSIKEALKSRNICTDYVVPALENMAQSVILFDHEGNRSIYTDLKDIQERHYDITKMEIAAADCEVLCLTNINFNRHLLSKAKEMGKVIATDVQELYDIHDAYNKDFLDCANILFLSDAKISYGVDHFVNDLIQTYHHDIIVVGMGNKGAYMYVRKDDVREIIPAVYTREVVNTVGAGDALFASFIHFYAKDHNPYDAIKKAMMFASYKIGDRNSTSGFLSEVEIERYL